MVISLVVAEDVRQWILLWERELEWLLGKVMEVDKMSRDLIIIIISSSSSSSNNKILLSSSSVGGIAERKLCTMSSPLFPSWLCTASCGL